MSISAVLPPLLVLDQLVQGWLIEDIGRGDRTTQSLLSSGVADGQAKWTAKQAGVMAGLPISERAFQILNDRVSFVPTVAEGERC